MQHPTPLSGHPAAFPGREHVVSQIPGKCWRISGVIPSRGYSQPGCREPCSSAGLGLLHGGGRCPEEPGDAEVGPGEAKLCRNRTREAVWRCGAGLWQEPASGHAASGWDEKENGLQTKSLKMPKDSSPPHTAFFLLPPREQHNFWMESRPLPAQNWDLPWRASGSALTGAFSG